MYLLETILNLFIIAFIYICIKRTVLFKDFKSGIFANI